MPASAFWWACLRKYVLCPRGNTFSFELSLALCLLCCGVLLGCAVALQECSMQLNNVFMFDSMCFDGQHLNHCRIVHTVRCQSSWVPCVHRMWSGYAEWSWYLLLKAARCHLLKAPLGSCHKVLVTQWWQEMCFTDTVAIDTHGHRHCGHRHCGHRHCVSQTLWP